MFSYESIYLTPDLRMPKYGVLVPEKFSSKYKSLGYRESPRKKFFKEKTRIRLESVNPRLEPTYVNKVKIQGEAIFLIRNF